MNLKTLIGLKMQWSSTLAQPFDGEPEVLYPRRSHTNQILSMNQPLLRTLAGYVAKEKKPVRYALKIECVYTVGGERYSDSDEFEMHCVYGDVTDVAVDCCKDLLEDCYKNGGEFERFNFYTEVVGI